MEREHPEGERFHAYVRGVRAARWPSTACPGSAPGTRPAAEPVRAELRALIATVRRGGRGGMTCCARTSPRRTPSHCSGRSRRSSRRRDEAAPEIWQRHVELLLDGLSGQPPRELGAPPVDRPQWDRFVRSARVTVEHGEPAARPRGVSIVHETVARRIVFGAGAIGELPAELERLGLHRPLVIAGRSQAAHAERLLAAVGAGASIIGVRVHVPAAHAAEAARPGGRARGRLSRLDRRRLGGRARQGRRAERRAADRGSADDLRGLGADDRLGHHGGGAQDDGARARRGAAARRSTTPS